MEAKTLLSRLLAGLLIALGGCDLTYTKPAARPERPVPSPPKNPPEVVQTEPRTAAPSPDQEADTVATAVQGYIQRVDDVARRTRRGVEPTPPGKLAVAQERVPIPPGEDAQHLPGTLHGDSEPQRAQPSDPSLATQPAGPASAPATPPTLDSVTVRAAALDPIVTPGAAAAVPGVNAAISTPHAPLNLSQFLAQWPDDAEDTSFARQLDRRVLHVVAGDYDRARQPLTLVSKEQQELAQGFIESLIAVREAHDGDPSAAANRVLQQLEPLRESLATLGDLRIPRLAICQEVVGFGQYRPIEPVQFRAGGASEFVAYCEVQGFLSEKQDDGTYCTRFEMRTRVLNAAGDPVIDLHDAEIVDRCRQRRNDCFIPRLVRLPPALPAGEYVVKVTLVDKLGGKVAENRAVLRLVAGP